MAWYAARMSAAKRLGFFLPGLVVSFLALFAGVAGAATPGSEAIDDLFRIVLLPALGIGILVQILLIYAVIKFRRRRGHTSPANPVKTNDSRLEAAWTIVPALILLLVGVATFRTLTITDTIPENPDVVVTVTGQQFFWSFRADNGTAVVNTTGELTVRVGDLVKLIITSTDVIHSFYIPAFNLKVDAVPGHENVYWFQALEAGDYEIRCAELCGVGHSIMVGTLHVVP